MDSSVASASVALDPAEELRNLTFTRRVSLEVKVKHRGPHRPCFGDRVKPVEQTDAIAVLEEIFSAYGHRGDHAV